MALHPLACGEPLVVDEEANRPDGSADAPTAADATPGSEDATGEAAKPLGPPPKNCRRTDAGLVCACSQAGNCEIDCSQAETCVDITCGPNTQCTVKCKNDETVECAGTCTVVGCSCQQGGAGRCMEG